MCGILAVCSHSQTGLNKFWKASRILKKRGPDSSSFHIKPNGLYFFNRLAINDIEHGYQPFIDDEITLMVNGEIFNHVELEEKYSIQTRTRSDCEVILHLYRKFRGRGRVGKKEGFSQTLNLLNGDFAIVLADGDDVFYARDMIGVRPLFVGKIQGGIALASVAQVLLEGGCDEVAQVVPGFGYIYNLSTQKGNVICVIGDVVDPDLVGKPIRTLLTNAVRKRLISDRPIGCFLSGGLDSSIITALLASMVGPGNLRTYSVGMEGSIDLKYARLVAEHLGTVHTEVLFTVEEGLAVIPEVIQNLESYDITTIRASVGMYILSKYIRDNTQDRVIFSGEGSDELFCGYLYFHNAPSVKEELDESMRLVNDLYLYDVLRADRMVSCNGLELRVPFLDKHVVEHAFRLEGCEKTTHALDGSSRIEKLYLRQAFSDLLPESVIWRQKCAFSDGVSSVRKSWYQYIQDYTNDLYKGQDLPPEFRSNEDRYYKTLFKEYFPTYNLNTPTWMPRWSQTNDPSARTLAVCQEEP